MLIVETPLLTRERDAAEHSPVVSKILQSHLGSKQARGPRAPLPLEPVGRALDPWNLRCGLMGEQTWDRGEAERCSLSDGRSEPVRVQSDPCIHLVRPQDTCPLGCDHTLELANLTGSIDVAPQALC